MAKLVITGGLGFLGQYVTQAVLKTMEDCEIVILARSKREIFLEELKDKRVKIIYGADITQKSTIEKYFPGADYVIHVAAMISFWYK